MDTLLPELVAMGPAGVVAAILGFLYWQERKERMSLHTERREEMKEMFGVVQTLRDALSFVEGRK